MAQHEATLTEENKRLEAENEKLKKQLASAKAHSAETNRRQETADTMRNTSQAYADETSKVVRGLTQSFFEGVRVYAEALTVYADEISGRNQTETYASAADQARNLYGDVFSGVAKSFNKLTEFPGRTIDKFYSTYKESPGQQPNNPTSSI
jgi:cell division septum initiation protein DivIVA